MPKTINKILIRFKIWLLVKPPGWIRRLSPRTVWRIPTSEKILYLTFDDGPVPGLTEWILQTLESFQARATFFCVGENVRKYPDLYDKILRAGHATGNHTFSHMNSYRTSVNKYIRDVFLAREVIDSGLFRPPYGRLRPRAARKLRPFFRVILWDVLSLDYESNLSAERVLDNVLAYSRPGSILVFHDNYKAFNILQSCLPEILRHYSSAGYRFEALDEVDIMAHLSVRRNR